jgi:3-phenylpropionate/trans-cinnamate dioxygenase ferredoxin reductase subunit
MENVNQTCAVVGAGHAGVTLAFALRNEGWNGSIVLYDGDPNQPYHRPPLSKALLTTEDSIEKFSLRSSESYRQEHISLRLGVQVVDMDKEKKHIMLASGEVNRYDKLVLATGARAFIPSISGLESATNVFTLRTAQDVDQIREVLRSRDCKRIVIVGGGYIGLEVAASLKKLNKDICILEREERILKRVTSVEMSYFFKMLHRNHGVNIFTGKTVDSIEMHGKNNILICSDGATFYADAVIIGAGIIVNARLAEVAGLDIMDGIKVNKNCQTSNPDIYAIGDCAYHYNPYYERHIRLESVHTAIDQAKIVASSLCGKSAVPISIPKFWSDQYDVKLQIAGLSTGYDKLVFRNESEDGSKFSIWYFRGDELLSVEAVNNAKAYVLGLRLLEERATVDTARVADVSIELKPDGLLPRPVNV